MLRISSKILSVLMLLSVVAAGCAPATEAPPEVEPTQPTVLEPTAEAPTAEPVVEAPTEVNIAAILAVGLTEVWDRSWYESMQRVIAERPHDLTVTLDYTEGVWGEDAEQVLREYAETGKYEIIFATSTYSDQVGNLKDEFPEILWVVHGSGNEGLAGNQYWVYMRVHEPAYLLGMLAGLMPETDVVGSVGSFAFDDVNDEINAFFEGAKAVNPDIKTRVTFIESWYDPVKAREATLAQAAAGVDFMLQIANAFEACKEAGIYCFGNYLDVNELAPDNIVGGTLGLWDPSIKWIIDEWYMHVTEGTPYNGNAEPRWFSMAEGGSGLAPYHGFEDMIPDEVMAQLEEAKEDILSGAFVVPLNIEVPVPSD